jgi:hypothetical protein
MRKLYGDLLRAIRKGSEVNEFEDYLPIEIEPAAEYRDPYTQMQSAVFSHIVAHPNRDIPFDELVKVAAEVDSHDVRNLAFGAVVALRNLELVDFDQSTLVARRRDPQQSQV